MKKLSVLLSLLPLALSSDIALPVLKGEAPIYIGDVFWPPSMTFFAGIPSEENLPEEFCSRAADASDDALFSLGSMDGLKIHDYFTTQAYITWNGNRFADCYISPESVKLPFCDGNKKNNGKNNFLGPANRKWTCWVVGIGGTGEDTERNSSGHGEMRPRAQGSPEKLTDSTTKPTMLSGAALSSSIIGAFTAAVTDM